jgi:signal transduction histidine kinase
MNPLNQKTRNLLEEAARMLRPHLEELSTRWEKSYKQIFPQETEAIIRTLDKLNVGTLAGCLERHDINAAIENITYQGRRLAKLGVSEEKIAASLKLYLQAARSLLKKQSSKLSDTEEIVSALEQLQLVEMMVALQSYSRIENEELETLISVMDADLTTEELDDFLRRLLALSTRTMHATSGQLVLVEEERPTEARILIDTAAKRQGIEGAVRAVLETGKPVFVHSGQKPAKAAKKVVKHERQTRSLWVFPIKVKTEPIGALVLRFAKHYECLPRECEVMEALLKRAALAIERVLLRDRISAGEQRIRELTERIIMVQDEERRRISRELHDETSHSLLVLRLYLEMIYKELPRSLAVTRKKTKEATALVEKTLKEMRRLISDLGPSILDDHGLVPALRWQARTIRDISKIKVSLRVGRNFPRLPRNLEVVIYRVVQESLNNAARHSRATEVDVGLQYRAESVNINIKDNGIGFDPKRLAELRRKSSFGLLSMQERISILGGTFAVDSRPREGTQVRVSLPAVPVE